MQNGKWSIQIVSGEDLSAAQNRILNAAGEVVLGEDDPTCIGSLEANAATTDDGEAVFVTYAGIATCVAGETPPVAFDLLMVEPTALPADGGRVTTASGEPGQVTIGQYIPELKIGTINPPLCVENEEITCFLFANKSVPVLEGP